MLKCTVPHREVACSDWIAVFFNSLLLQWSSGISYILVRIGRNATVSLIHYKHIRIVLAQIWLLQVQLNYQPIENPLDGLLNIYNLLMIRLCIGLLKAIPIGLRYCMTHHCDLEQT